MLELQSRTAYMALRKTDRSSNVGQCSGILIGSRCWDTGTLERFSLLIGLSAHRLFSMSAKSG
jgi:hypothetical protein